MKVQVTDACAPRVTASPFYTCRRHKRDFRPPRYRRPTVHPCARSRPSSWLPATSSTCADRDDQSVSMEMVRTRLARLREHPPGCCQLCGRRPRWRLPTSTASPRRGSGRPPPPGCAHCADSRSIDEVALRSRWPPIPAHPGGAVIVALRRAQLARWAPGVRIFGQTAHYSQAVAHFVDRRSRGSGGAAQPRENGHLIRSPGLRGVTGCPTPTTIVEQLLERNPPCRWVLESMGQPPSIPSFFHPISRRASGLGLGAFPLRCFASTARLPRLPEPSRTISA